MEIKPISEQLVLLYTKKGGISITEYSDGSLEILDGKKRIKLMDMKEE